METILKLYRQANLSKLVIIFVVILFLDNSMTFVQYATAESTLEEYQIKAVFLFNFAKFVEWPEGSFKNSDAPIIITILGKDPFGEALDALKEKTINSRGIVVKRAPSPEHLVRSHILFVCKSERDNLPKILEVAQKWDALTVGDMKGFAQSGGMINLVKIGEKISFEINVSATDRTNLKISSKLLKLATNLYHN